MPKGLVEVSDLALGESVILGRGSPALLSAAFKDSILSDMLASLSSARIRLRFVFRYSPAVKTGKDEDCISDHICTFVDDL